MATTKEIIEKYHKIIPFPITLAKIRKAGKEPKSYLQQIGNDLQQCTDADRPLVKKIIAGITAQWAAVVLYTAMD